MSLIPSTGLRNSQATKLATTFDSAVLNLYSGSQPDSPDDAPTGDLLVSIIISSPVFSGPVDGVLSRGSVWEGAAVASGDIGYGRFVLSGDSGGNSETDERFDVDVGLTDGNIIQLLSVSINVDQKIRINNVSLEFPVVPSGISGVANMSLPQLILNSSGSVQIKGDVFITLPILELEASGSTFVGAGANLVLPQFELTAAGQVEIQGEAELTLPQFELIASEGDTIVGASELTLPQLTLSASGGVEVQGVSNLTLPQLQLNASGTSPRFGSANLILPKLIVVASGTSSAPPVSDLWPNSPSIFTPGVDLNYTFLANKTYPTQPAGTWSYSGDWASSNISMVSDNGPVSPPNALRMFWPAGFGQGTGVGRAVCGGSAMINTPHIYVAFYLKWSANWTNHPTGTNKICYFASHQGLLSGTAFSNYYLNRRGNIIDMTLQYGQGYDPIRDFDSARNIPDGFGPPRLASTSVAAETYHLIELIGNQSTNGQPNGRVRVWVDRILQFDATDVRWVPSGNSLFRLGINKDSVWGGNVVGVVKPNNEFIHYDHIVVRGFS